MDKSPDAFRTISEVADFLETPAHVLRFWESRFPQIKPVKRAGGRRYYRPADVALLAGIRQLLHQDGMTIRGVQKILRDQGVKHVIGLSDPHFQIPPDTDHDEAEGDIADVQIVDMPESEAVAAHGSTNVVALTDWRAVAEPAEAALSMATMPPATPEAEDQQVATPAPVALGGASLAAELEAATAVGMTAQEGASPHQWSLFDLAGAETPATLLTDPHVTADLAHAAPGAALEHTALESQAALDVPLEPTAVGAAPVITGVDSLAEASSGALPDQIALRADDSSASATPDTLSPAEIDASTPLGDRPWLPPRLRALRAASAALPSGDLAALLLRARALHGTLKDAAQPPRG